jgi:thiol-disulfide isomerase/thioredoxin
MKKLFTSLSFALMAGLSFGQVGATAPDFTVTDINGTQHTLYSYLNSGKVVLLDVSATWCGPCWNFHNAHYLEDLYAEYGPAGTNEVVVLFYEGDAATNAQDLDGTDAASQGDWITGTPYPIINETPLQLNLNIYAPLGFPTINIISCADNKIKWDLWDSQVSGNTAQSLQNMRAKVQEAIDACAVSAGIEDLSTIETTIAPNPTKDVVNVSYTVNSNQEATIEVFNISGANLLTSTTTAVTGLNSMDLDLSQFEAGTYFVKVSTSDASSKMAKVIKN